MMSKHPFRNVLQKLNCFSVLEAKARPRKKRNGRRSFLSTTEITDNPTGMNKLPADTLMHTVACGDEM